MNLLEILRQTPGALPGQNRRYAYHARVGHGTYARDRRVQSNCRDARRHPETVFAESVMLTVISGFLELSFGMGICVAIKLLPLPDFVPRPNISPISIVASVLSLSLITFTTGMYAATRSGNDSNRFAAP